jgi:SacI homology domain
MSVSSSKPGAAVLTQGMAASRQFTDSAGKRFSLALISRRSCLHPGMRYIARGLNALASPGNESEVEQIVWTTPTGKQPAMLSSVSSVFSLRLPTQ